MNINTTERELILKRQQQLQAAITQLQQEFVGLDDVIAEISNLVESWYLFPHGQIRPTVVNLWGLTGVGKSSLINRLFELLQVESVIKFDIGDFADDNSQSLRYKISSQLRKVKKNHNIPVFVFDEFQLGRTVDEEGIEMDRGGLRVIWDLLDSGKFELVEDTWENAAVVKLYTKLACALDDGVEVDKGKIVKGKATYDKIFGSLEDDGLNTGSAKYIKKYYTTNPFVPVDEIWMLKKLNEDRFVSDAQLTQYLCTLNGREILSFVEETMDQAFQPVRHDFSSSIIFIIGNLDEAYKGTSYSMSPDIDADSLYDLTSKITITDIKKALLARFRAEQISRLGNNHIIYKSLNSQMYRDLVRLELARFQQKIQEKFAVQVAFTPAMHDLMYKEGVFPAQGVRPIFSTLVNLIESYVGRILVDSIKQQWNYDKIEWDFNDNEYHLQFIGYQAAETDEKLLEEVVGELTYPVKLKTESLRVSTQDDRQALVGVHEAGHVVAAIYGSNICPKHVVSKTADNECGGFTHVEGPDYESKEYLLSYLQVCIGGYMAEKLVFGEENLTTGSHSDMSNITEAALCIVKDYGMVGLPVRYSFPDFRVGLERMCSSDNLDEIAEDLVKDALTKTEKILKDNMTLVLKLGEYLAVNSKMDTDEIKAMVVQYGTFVPTYKTKDNWYQYKNILEGKLNLMEKKKTSVKKVSAPKLESLVLNEEPPKKRIRKKKI